MSYRRVDASGHAGRLYDLLTDRYGAQHVFMDVDAIQPGAVFGDTISQAVTWCDVFIALIGRSWLNTEDADGRRRIDDPGDYVRREIETALTAGVVVVPTLVQGASMPRADELPPTLEPLVRRHGITLGDAGWRDDVARLIRQLEASGDHRERSWAPGARSDTPEGARTPGRPPRAPPNRRRIALSAIVALIALAGVALALTLPAADPHREPTAGSNPRSSGDPETRLLSVVPAVTKAGCDRSSSFEPPVEASLSCDVASTLTATYLQFPGRAEADAWYRQQEVAETDGLASGGCTLAQFDGETVYRVDGDTAGRSFCYLDEERRPVLFALDARVTVGLEVGVFNGRGQAAIEDLLDLWSCCIRIDP